MLIVSARLPSVPYWFMRDGSCGRGFFRRTAFCLHLSRSADIDMRLTAEVCPWVS